MSLRITSSRPVLALMVLVAALASGCSSKGDVSGKVKFNGQLLPSGRITFASEVGRKEVFTSPIKDGSYSITGVPAGPVKVRIETFKPSDSKAPDGGKGKYVAIPLHYADFQKSGQDFEVTGGPQTHDFNLKP